MPHANRKPPLPRRPEEVPRSGDFLKNPQKSLQRESGYAARQLGFTGLFSPPPKLGESLARSFLGPIDYSPVLSPENKQRLEAAAKRNTPEENLRMAQQRRDDEAARLQGGSPPAPEPPYQLSPLMRSKVTRDTYGQPSAPVARDLDIEQWTERHKYLNQVDDGYPAAPRILGIAPTTPQPPTDPMDTGGLDRGDPTSFAPPTEELEPAWVKRERERDRKRLLSQTQRQLRKR